MALFKEENNNPKSVETIIGPSVKVEGNFFGQGNIVVDGHVSGSIKTEHDLKIGKGAKIKAEIEANNIYIAGEVRGNLKIKEKLEISNTAKVNGNIETKIISVESGALFNGKCTMGSSVEPTENIIKQEKRNNIK